MESPVQPVPDAAEVLEHPMSEALWERLEQVSTTGENRSSEPAARGSLGPLVCPFFARYPAENIRCQWLTFDTIRRVQQHLYRRHSSPHCLLCHEQFPSHVQRDKHMALHSCTQIAAEWTSRTIMQCEREKEVLSRGSRRNLPSDGVRLGAYQKWLRIWDILFPDAVPPSSRWTASSSNRQFITAPDPRPGCSVDHNDPRQLNPSEVIRFLEQATRSNNGVLELTEGLAKQLLEKVFDAADACAQHPQKMTAFRKKETLRLFMTEPSNPKSTGPHRSGASSDVVSLFTAPTRTARVAVPPIATHDEAGHESVEAWAAEARQNFESLSTRDDYGGDERLSSAREEQDGQILNELLEAFGHQNSGAMTEHQEPPDSVDFRKGRMKTLIHCATVFNNMRLEAQKVLEEEILDEIAYLRGEATAPLAKILEILGIDSPALATTQGLFPLTSVCNSETTREAVPLPVHGHQEQEFFQASSDFRGSSGPRAISVPDSQADTGQCLPAERSKPTSASHTGSSEPSHDDAADVMGLAEDILDSDQSPPMGPLRDVLFKIGHQVVQDLMEEYYRWIGEAGSDSDEEEGLDSDDAGATSPEDEDGRSSEQQNTPSSNSSGPTRLPSKRANQSSQGGPRKRRKGRGTLDNEESQDEDQDASETGKTTARRHVPGRRFDCPIAKCFPHVRHLCLKSGEVRGWLKINHVKDHLERRHVPVFWCPRCKEVFSSMEEVHEHWQQSQQACEVRESFRDGILNWDIKRFKAFKKERFGKDLPPCDQWFVMWKRLFGELQPPDSPYVDEADMISYSTLRTFLEVQGERRMGELLRARLRQHPRQDIPDLSDEVVEILGSLIPALCRQLLEGAVQDGSLPRAGRLTQQMTPQNTTPSEGNDFAPGDSLSSSARQDFRGLSGANCALPVPSFPSVVDSTGIGVRTAQPARGALPHTRVIESVEGEDQGRLFEPPLQQDSTLQSLDSSNIVTTSGEASLWNSEDIRSTGDEFTWPMGFDRFLGCDGAEVPDVSVGPGYSDGDMARDDT